MFNNHRLFGSCDDLRDQNGSIRDLASSQFINTHLPLYNIPQYQIHNQQFHFHNPSTRTSAPEIYKAGQKRLKENDAIQYLNQVFVLFSCCSNVILA